MTLPGSIKASLIWGLTTLVVCIGLSGLIIFQAHRHHILHTESILVKEVNRLADETIKRIGLYQYGLRGARGFALAQQNQLTRQSFLLYSRTRNYQVEFPGARGFGLIWRVPRAEENEFVKKAIASGLPNFKIKELAPHQGERYVIEYIEPFEKNSPAIGLDIASEINRRKAAEAAIVTGDIQITAPITLIQAIGKPDQSFLLLLPIYSGWVTPTTEKERWQQAIGWSFAPLLMEDILAGLNLDSRFYNLRLADIGDPARKIDFYHYPEVLEEIESTANNSLSPASITRKVYGRLWKFTLSAKPSLIQHIAPVPLSEIYLFGGIFSLLISLIAAFIGNNRYVRQENIAHQSALAAIVESTNDAIIGKTLTGVITSWNKGAEKIFGYTQKEALGKTIDDLLIPDSLKAEHTSILQKVRRGEPVKQFVTQRLTKSDQLIDVLVNVSPVSDLDGKVISASKTVSDISEIKSIERKILELNLTLEAKVQDRTKELDDARRSLQTLLDAVPSVISFWDKQLVNQFANHAHLIRFNLAVEQIKGKSIGQVIGYEMFSKILPKLELTLEGYPQKIEHSVFKNGREYHYLVHLLPDNHYGTIHGFYFIEHDITEQFEGKAKLTKALREQQALLNTINTQYLYSVTDLSGTILDVNDYFCEATGYSRQELIGNNHRLVNSGLHPKGFWRDMWLKVKTGQAWRAEVCNSPRQGEPRWFDMVVAPMMDDSGKIEKLIALSSDITARKQAEYHRNQLNQLIETILSSATEFSIIATDLEGTITLFNSGAERMLGYSASDMVNQYTPKKIHLDDEIEQRGKELSLEYGIDIQGFDVFTQKAKSGQSETRIWTYLTKDDRQLQVSLTISAMFDPAGELIGYLGIAVDITEQLALENELRKEKENADKANIAKSQFLANMSHEIRTPMNAVLGMLQLIQRTSLNNVQQDYVIKARSAAQSLLGILNDILDFSKIEAGKLMLDPTAFSLEDLLEELAVILSANLKEQKVEILFDTPSDLPKAIIGDKLRLQQVLVNLAGNALKFTSQGQVLLRIKRLAQDEQRINIRISVEDTGIGISPEQQQKIFTGFTQAEASTTRRYGGTGLGLVICKRLVNLMGSKLYLHSELGKGSHFWFDLDLPVADTSRFISPDLPYAAQILLVYNNPTLLNIYSETLTKQGYRVDQSSSYGTAMEKIKQADNRGSAYDLLIVDCDLGQEEGIQIIHELNRIETLAKKPVCIMTAAYNQDIFRKINQQDRQSVSNLLIKPLSSRQLITAVQQVLLPQIQSNQPDADAIYDLRGLDLLVVEDNELNRQVAFELLESAGAKVELAEGGWEGVNKVYENPHKYHLIIMDIQMPDMDGFEATRRIRQHPATAEIPILAMTANASESDRHACLNAGMNEHTGKPFDLVKLVPLIHGLVKKQIIDSQTTDPETLAAESVQTSRDLLEDKQALLNRYANNIELFRRFQKKLKPDVEKLLNNLQNLSKMDAPAIILALHSIKGLSATLGATALAQLASELEKKSKEQILPKQQDIQKLRDLLDASVIAMENMDLESDQLDKKIQHQYSDDLDDFDNKLLQKLLLLSNCLQNANMQALPLIDQLKDSLPQDEITNELIDNIHALDFSRAHDLLINIMKKMGYAPTR